MIVMKFGGSSLKDALQIRRVTEIIEKFLPEKPLIVLSAMNDTTDHLLQLAKEALERHRKAEALYHFHLQALKALNLPNDLLDALFMRLNQLLDDIYREKSLSLKRLDHILSFGEQFSTHIVAAFLTIQNRPAKALSAIDISLQTTADFTRAEPLLSSMQKIRDYFSAHKTHYPYIPIITGFMGITKEGHITTLGRGGSDLTASFIGASVNAKEIQVWKDVDGLMTADPKLVPMARRVDVLSFEEASELAYFGANVFHPKAILPAMQCAIPLRVKNTYNPSCEGSLIIKEKKKSPRLVTALTRKTPVVLVDICSTRMLGQYGFLASLFAIFDELRLSVDVIATSEVSVSLTLDDTDHLLELKKRLSVFSTVSIQKQKAIVTIVGNVAYSTKILQEAFAVFEMENIRVEMVSCGASKVNMSFIVSEEIASLAIQKLHNHFFKD